MHAESKWRHNKDERTQFFRKIYLSLYLKGFRKGYEGYYCVRGDLETEQNCNLLTPTLLAITAFSFPFSWAAQPGGWGPSISWDMVLTPASSLKLIWSTSRWGYIIFWRPPTSCERHNSHSIQPLDSQGRPWSFDFFDRMHLLFTQVHSFSWLLGRVRGQ